MTGNQRRRQDKYENETAYIKDNAGFFPPTSPGALEAQAQDVDLALLETLAVKQIAETGKETQQFGLKDDDVDEMVDLQRRTRRAASLMDNDDGFADLFPYPPNRSEQALTANGRVYSQNVAGREAEFELYDLPAGLSAKFVALADAIDAQDIAADVAEERGGEATGEIKAVMTRCAKRSRRLDKIVRNKFGKNAGKLAAWIIASRLEKDPQKDDDDGKPTS